MAFVVSEGSLQGLDQPMVQAPYALRLSDDLSQDYATIWRTQPSVRMVVSFLARNIASLSIHTFRRVSDTDRARVTDHPLAMLLDEPNPFTTRYRLIDALVHDLGIFDNAYLLKVKGVDGKWNLVRIPPQKITPGESGWMAPVTYTIEGNRGKISVPSNQIVHLHGYNPDDSRVGSSPLESLRRTLVEEYQAGEMREGTLRNGARTAGYLERPPTAKWSNEARERFRAQWKQQYTGGGPETGGTPILEDGMKFVAASQTAEQLQYIEGRKLTREEVATAYFIPPPMVGILDHASFSNISEQHKMLYQDTLGPWLTAITQDLTLQLFGDFSDTDGLYMEFNLAEKLRGSFEEQMSSFSTSVGAPTVTRNEARGRMNLPSIEGGDELVTPLNVLIGGMSSPQDGQTTGGGGGSVDDLDPAANTPDEADALKARLLRPVTIKGRAPASHDTKAQQVLAAFFERQSSAVQSRLGASASNWWDADRWNADLSKTILSLSLNTSEVAALAALTSAGREPGDYDTDRTIAFLTAAAEKSASQINATTKAKVDHALESDDDGAVANVFNEAKGSRAVEVALGVVTFASAFGTVEAARQTSSGATKTWRTTSSKPRKSHARLNGETVGIDDVFSNGLRWPGGIGDPDETAGCQCEMDINFP